MAGKVADDLIVTEYVRKDGQVHHKSDFSRAGPNRKWTTDVSQFTFPWGECCLSPIKDMYDGRIAAYGLSLRPGLSQTKRMLGAAFSLGYDLKGLMFHSDQGWQYTRIAGTSNRRRGEGSSGRCRGRGIASTTASWNRFSGR